MRKISAVLAVAMTAVIAQPAQGQLIERAGGILTGRTGARVDTRADTRVDTRTGTVYGSSSTNADVPRGHLPPRGMCRVWIEGVPPGHQPRPTDCRRAESERYRYGANARVIYGDQTPHPGQGRASRDARRSSSVETVIGARRGEWERRDRDDDDDRWEDRERDGSSKARAKAAKERRKAAKKGRGNGRG